MTTHKTQSKDWHLMDKERFAIGAENMFLEEAKFLPILIFINKKTAEIKMFSRKMAEEIGINNLKL